MIATRFNIQTADEAATVTLQRALGLPHFMAATLVGRGIDTPKAASDFLVPSLARDWLDPYEIKGMNDVVNGLEAAIKDKKKILVFGDFDLDGISATTVLTRALRVLGTTAIPFIPLRAQEGYGLSEAAIKRCLSLHAPDVVVTVDCGIACREEVKMLQHHGVEVFITDHHEPSDLVPVDVPVCDPKLEENSRSSILAGVGVALKLIQALGARFGQPHLWREYTDLATLGTIADLMPMHRGNRALVADGVKRMNDHPRPCIAALLASSGAADKPVTASSLSFSIIPRLNAAGRMGDADPAIDLLLADDRLQCEQLAAGLEAINDKRRTVEAELAEIAIDQAKEIYHDQRALVVAGEGWHEGVKGIVAGRLVRMYGVPTLLFTIDHGQARGSGRSVGDVNLFKAVESCSDLLTKFGGHAAAVGVTLPADVLPEFTRRLCAYMDTLPEDCFHPRIDIDSCVGIDELTLDNVEKMQMMAPFGQENRQPRFLARDVMLSRCRAVGAAKNHFSCSLTDGRASIDGIMFHCSSIDTLMSCDSVVNAAFEVQIDEWRGRRSVKAMLDSLAPTQTCAALEACLKPEQRSFISDLYATSDAELCADTPEDMDAFEDRCRHERQRWEQEIAADPSGTCAHIVSSMIGEKGHLYKVQQQILDALSQGTSTLAIAATGRGKSLTFCLFAAYQALRYHKVSLFIYPLRALISDQAFHIDQTLGKFGIVSLVLTGSSSPQERAAAYEAMAQGTVDIVLTTPEFLERHVDKFRSSGRIDFVVVDEAHHIALSRAGHRIAYAHLGDTVARLGKPTVLALTATADEATSQTIKNDLGIKQMIIDPTSRDNISLDDQRNLFRRDSYLANLLAMGEKTIVYVNSRQRSVSLARMLRRQIPQLAPLIGFYNAGLTREDRERIESMFRSGAFTVLVATSAFGEGVDIPDVRHVVLYHMPFNRIEFNQMSGRVGRDGKPATVHLLFGRDDAGLDERLLADSTPAREVMGLLYRELRAQQQAAGQDWFEMDDAGLAAACTTDFGSRTIAPASAACAIASFRELGLIETRPVHPGDEAFHSIHVITVNDKVELTDSARYREGLEESELFRIFRTWIFDCSSQTLRFCVTHAIYPGQTPSLSDIRDEHVPSADQSVSAGKRRSH